MNAVTQLPSISWLGHLQHLVLKLSQKGRERGGCASYVVWVKPGKSVVTSTHSIGQNSATWPHLTAKNAGECHLYVCQRGRRDGFGDQLASLCHSAIGDFK